MFRTKPPFNVGENIKYKWAALRQKVPYVLSQCHTKRMATAAPDIRDLFAWRHPNGNKVNNHHKANLQVSKYNHF